MEGTSLLLGEWDLSDIHCQRAHPPGTYTRTEADVDMNEEATLRAMEPPPLDDGIEHLIDRPAERWATEVAGWGAR